MFMPIFRSGLTQFQGFPSRDPLPVQPLASAPLRRVDGHHECDSCACCFRAGVKARLKAFVDRGQLGPFGNAYWGHPAYRLPPEANLMAVAHYLAALEWQRDFIKLHAVLGGKNPHLQSFLVGGMATPIARSPSAY